MNCNYIHGGDNPPEICPVCAAGKEKFSEAKEIGIGAGDARAVHTVIAGGGIAGLSAAEKIREVSPGATITVVAGEEELPYYRLNLTRYLAGEIGRDSLPLHPESWYAEQGITLIRGVSVHAIDPETKSLTLSDDRTLDYEKLILAVGSHPFVPPLPGAKLEGVRTLRTSGDADNILEHAGKSAKCVCIGGGILGIETAGALARQGADITMLESHGWLMPRQLNEKAAKILEKHIAGIGVKVIKKARSKEIYGENQVAGILLEDGRRIPADLVILATGVRPNTSLARKIGLDVNGGIVVDHHLCTSVPDIYAAGDVAEHNGVLYGAWAASQFQGSIAALNAVGIPTQFGGIPRSNTVKALGLDLTSVGKFMPEDGSYVVLEKEEEGAYLEFILRDGRMIGAILVAHAELASPVKKAIDSKTDFTSVLSAVPSVEAVIEHFRKNG
jgi:nitrite reductase (NADH) large subunit